MLVDPHGHGLLAAVLGKVIKPARIQPVTAESVAEQIVEAAMHEPADALSG